MITVPNLQILKCISQLELAQLIGTGVKAMAGPSGGAGQGLSTPVHFGTAGLPSSQAHELVNGT